jgi:hypothetical protein
MKNKVPSSFNRQPDIAQLHYNTNGINREYNDKYWDFIHIMGRTYDNRDENTQNAMKCLFYSLCDIIPDENFRTILNNFINMDNRVVETLIKSTEAVSFLQAYPDMNIQLKNYKSNFFNYCFEQSDRLFSWTFLLHNYYNVIMGLPGITFNQLNEMYNKKNIPKNRWGNSMWFMINHTAIYAPEILPENWKLSYKSFISGLQWTVPCGECRGHIAKNLQQLEDRDIAIDNYLTTNIKIFESSVSMQNAVNVMLKKPEITLQEAINIHRPGYRFRGGK